MGWGCADVELVVFHILILDDYYDLDDLDDGLLMIHTHR